MIRVIRHFNINETVNSKYLLTAYYSANIGAMNKLPRTNQLLLRQRRGFGPHWDVINIFPMTHQVLLQVKRTVSPPAK